ncbi:MAG: hypothetical protein HQ500_02070 [Flavobacteriales bacterium]|nr:hypothetical protein [Flavobacteriales bacterium]
MQLPIRILSLALLSCFFSLAIFAQTKFLDDVFFEQIASEKDIPTKVDLIYKMGFHYYGVGLTEDAQALWNQAGELSREDNYPIGLAVNTYLEGLDLYNQDKTAEGMRIMLEALDRLDELRFKAHVHSPLSNFRMVLNREGEQQEKYEFYRKRLDHYIKYGPIESSAAALHGIANYFYFMNNYEKAIEYYMRSAKMHESFAKDITYSVGEMVVGNIYSEWGNQNKALEKFDVMDSVPTEEKFRNFHYYNNISRASLLEKVGKPNESIRIYRALLNSSDDPSPPLRSAAALEIARLLAKLGEYDSVTAYLNIADSLVLQYSLEIWTPVANVELNFTKFLYYNTLNDDEQANQFLALAIEDAEKVKHVPLMLKYYKAASEHFAAIDDNKNLAYHYLVKHDALSDSLAKSERENRIAAYENLLNEERVEAAHKAEVEEKDSIRNIAFASTLILLLLAVGLFSRVRFIRRSRKVIEQERDRSDELLLNILPEEIAKELKDSGRAEARDFKVVSILFTDFKDFTAASEKLSAQDLVSEINTCFEAFDRIMAKYHIEKIKTIGDSYMAAGGLPVPTDDSVKNTVLAALEMQAFIGARSEELGARGLPFFEMRVGIHTGPVVAGIVGVKKFQYDIWGDTVNTASRMESAGEIGKVNISQVTHDLLKDDPQFTFESRGKIEAKGKGEMEMYFISEK